MTVEVFMPKMSDHMETGEIIRWLVKEGDRVEQGQVIMEVMTDKVVAEFEAPASGILKGIRAGAESGATVAVGETFAFIAQPGESVPVLPPLAPGEGGAQTAGKPAASAAEPGAAALPLAPGGSPLFPQGGEIRATPVVRRLAKELGVDLALVRGSGSEGRIREEDVRALAVQRDMSREPAVVPQAGPAEEPGAQRTSPLARRIAKELGVDLTLVKGTGPGGRIREEDVRAFADAQKARPVVPAPPPAPAPGEWVDLSSIQRLTGQRMLESIQTAPQFALTISVDTTNLSWLREALMERIAGETGERLSITALLVKIVAAALKSHPRANAAFENGRVRLHPQVNVGVAVGAEDGLVVPVVKSADQKSLGQIVQEIKVFQDKAQRMRFSSDDLSDGTFTLSNLGMYGIDHFNAIINPPQSAILAVGRVVKTPVGMPDDTVALRPMMTMTLTVDHRAMDGVNGARFLAEIKERIEKPYFLL
jgi:pyruvate dehydrogenase E2 component (dihydrolipoyllysine-residue acetyltransferase)